MPLEKGRVAIAADSQNSLRQVGAWTMPASDHRFGEPVLNKILMAEACIAPGMWPSLDSNPLRASKTVGAVFDLTGFAISLACMPTLFDLV